MPTDKALLALATRSAGVVPGKRTVPIWTYDQIHKVMSQTHQHVVLGIRRCESKESQDTRDLTKIQGVG